MKTQATQPWLRELRKVNISQLNVLRCPCSPLRRRLRCFIAAIFFLLRVADVSHGDITLAELNGLPSATVELDANGRCRLYVGGQSLSGHWTLNGNSAELYCAWKKFTGIFSENKLALRSNDSNSAALLFMLGSTKDDGGSIPAGKYKLIAIDDNGTAYTGSVIDASEPVAWYISIKRDGSGSAAVFSEEADEISVDSRYIILRGMRLAYTIDGDALTLEYPGGIKLTFEK